MYDNFDAINQDGKFKFWTGEIDNDELGAWLRLLGMASRSSVKGLICIDGGYAYTFEQIKKVIKTDKNFIEKWEKQGAIKIEKGLIYIVNWSIYQTEQERKDGYKKLNSPLNSPPKKTVKKPRIDVDVDVDLDVKENLHNINKKKNTPVGIKPADDAPGKRAAAMAKVFYVNYQYYIKTPYIASFAADNKIFSQICKVLTETDIETCIKYYLQSSDTYYKKAGYNIQCFRGCINAIKTAALKTEPAIKDYAAGWEDK